MAYTIMGFANMNFVGQASRLENQAGILCLEVEFFLFKETLVFNVKAFNWLDEAYPHNKQLS